jgi:hypothetical protein
MLSSASTKANSTGYQTSTVATSISPVGQNSMVVGPTGILYVIANGAIKTINPVTGAVANAYTGLSAAGSSALVLAPNGMFLYNNGNTSGAAVYAIGGPYASETLLFYLNSPNPNFGTNPSVLAIDSTGTIIYCMNYSTLESFSYSGGTWSLTGFIVTTSPSYYAAKLVSIAVDAAGTIWGVYPGIMYNIDWRGQC